jgi:hypothetical protein
MQHSERFFSKSFGTPLSISFHQCFTFTQISTGQWMEHLLAAAVPKTWSHPIVKKEIILWFLGKN